MNSVEHRFKKRQTVSATVYIMRDGRLTQAKAINASSQGLLLSAPSFQCPPNVKIQICCTLSRRFYEIPAITIHSNLDKLGIEFTSAQPQFYKALKEVSGKDTTRTAVKGVSAA